METIRVPYSRLRGAESGGRSEGRRGRDGVGLRTLLMWILGMIDWSDHASDYGDEEGDYVQMVRVDGKYVTEI